MKILESSQVRRFTVNTPNVAAAATVAATVAAAAEAAWGRSGSSVGGHGLALGGGCSCRSSAPTEKLVVSSHYMLPERRLSSTASTAADADALATVRAGVEEISDRWGR